MKQECLDSLKLIVGNENVSCGPDAAVKFLHPHQHAPLLTVVKPADDEDVQKILKVAHENEAVIITANDFYLEEEDLDKEGVLLDFSRMNRIERIDALNLVAHIERGVTWDQLNAELKPLGVKAAASLAANSLSVAECAAARVVCKAVSRFPDYPLMNLKLVLADGMIHKTSAHSLSEEGPDGRYHDGGPNFSTWYIGSDDIFGVMTRVSIPLWPVCECRSCLVYAFDDYDSLLAVLKDVPRTELGVEYLGINNAYMARLLEQDAGELPEWTLVVGFEGRRRHVAYQEGKVKDLLAHYTCKPVNELIDTMTEKLDQPWGQASFNHIDFFSLFSQLKGHDSISDQGAAKAGIAKKNIGKLLVSFDLGRAVHAVYDWFDHHHHQQDVEDLQLKLSGHGAFFGRPHGALARKIYTAIPHHLPILKKIKGFLDKDNMLNPGRIIKDEDDLWQPAEVGEGEIGLTVNNLKVVKEKLGEAIGADWVSDNPTDLSPYGHDFTIFSGERPNIVVLPATTEEVQSVIRIAYAHGVPVVPLSTGFNHGGLTVSRKGGLLVDLKRVSNPCTIDEETMTATISPGVRMRTVWWEAVSLRAAEGFHLKPILPLTFASVSMLSNYVARGGAGTAFKYGGNPEMTTNMTWVLPNGDIFKIGPGALPETGNLPIHYCPGPEINGMFFNADGMFGICTEITAKLYPEKDNVDDDGLEDLMSAANFDPDSHQSFRRAIDAVFELSRENITDFMYKSHPGVFALMMAALKEDLSVQDVINASPQHPLGIMISGYDQEELEIKREIVKGVLDKHEMFVIDPNMFDPELAKMQTTDAVKKSLGINQNIAGTYKGAFQWTACAIKMEKIPAIAKEYDQKKKKYWKTSDPTVSVEHAMTGTDIQGPLQYGRAGSVEFDWWWDQGNPEEVKRATTMIHRTNKLMLKYGGALFRNMFGAGEYHLPMLSSYYTLLKRTKKAFDPENLMHPDVLPVTDDYI